MVDKDGKPQPAIRIERKWNCAFGNHIGSDERTTDSQGRFEFPTVTAKSLFVS
ncbi:MAG: hypothetical protein RL701_8112 [Pseudomonadota bacterium]|jgi:hypothetical protein